MTILNSEVYIVYSLCNNGFIGRKTQGCVYRLQGRPYSILATTTVTVISLTVNHLADCPGVNGSVTLKKNTGNNAL